MASAATLQRTFDQSLDGVQHGIYSLYQPGSSGQGCYNTAEVGHKLRTMNNAVDHLRLDDHFLRNSQPWRQRFNERDLQEHQCGVVNGLSKAQHFLHNYGHNMDSQRVANLQENEVREHHQWAKKNINCVLGELAPRAQTSHDRVQRFCDWIGVTDRFTGYRNNLTRPRASLDYDPPWRRGDRPQTQMKFVSESTPQRCQGRFMMGSCPQQISVSQSPVRVNSAPVYRQDTRSITDQCGINTRFPGTTEFQDRYNRPVPQLSYDYRINPIPDFGVIGRPVLPKEPDVHITEYNFRYQVPDASKVDTLPWRRK